MVISLTRFSDGLYSNETVSFTSFAASSRTKFKTVLNFIVKLEYLGLTAAAVGFCKELSGRQGVKIDFLCDGLPEDLSSEVSLCLFRVLQEALHNAVKYSGVGEFEVSLTGSLNEVQLRVHDSGAGFDPTIASNGHGLGLTSMKERLRLVNGKLSVDSSLHQGTTVFASVLLAEGMTNPGAAA
jgi:signal transduction histidine kinase